MFCYKCGCELGRTDHCPNCGADVATYKKIIYTSNYLYNDGLEKARVRDLSGAILSLKNSLWYNKDNLDARNLLGLIYYEIGETVAALAEWVISKNINDERLHLRENLGADYLDQVQASRQTMENLDNSIERYNQALECCYTDNLDVAVLQLKKVLQINPHYLRARQLLALLYIENGNHRKAYRELEKCLRIDVGNTTTLRYMSEVESILGLESGSGARGTSSVGGGQHTVRTVKTAGTEAEPQTAGKKNRKGKKEKLPNGSVIKYTDGNEVIIQPVNARNPGVDGFGIPSWIYGGIIGLIVGAALVAFLVMPARVQTIRTDSQDQIREVSEQLTVKEQTITDLETEVTELEESITALEEELAAALEEDETTFEVKANVLMSTAAYYLEDSADTTNAEAAMIQILPSEASEDVSEEFTQLYEQLYALLRVNILQEHADLGILEFEAEDTDYETVVYELTLANEFEDPEDLGTTWPQRQYYLAYSYYQLYLQDTSSDEAVQYILEAETVIENLAEAYPDSEYTTQANTLLDLLPDVTVEETSEEESSEEDSAEEISDDGSVSGEASEEAGESSEAVDADAAAEESAAAEE